MVTDASVSPAGAGAACSTVSRFARLKASPGEDRSAIAFLNRCTHRTMLASRGGGLKCVTGLTVGACLPQCVAPLCSFHPWHRLSAAPVPVGQPQRAPVRIVERSHPDCRKPVQPCHRTSKPGSALQCGARCRRAIRFTPPDTWTMPPASRVEPRSPTATPTLQRSKARSYRSIVSAVQQVQLFKGSIVQRSSSVLNAARRVVVWV
jgi:hypothetical protein